MDETDDLALGKDGAHRAHGHGRVGRQGSGGQLVGLNAERLRHHFKEPPGAGRALVVHLEVEHAPPRPKQDYLGVLTADVKDRARLREQVSGAQRVGADLGDHTGAKARGCGVAPVARGHQPVAGSPPDEKGGDLLRLEAGIEDGAVCDRAVCQPHGIDGA